MVTPASATLVSLGETVQLTPSAKDANGNAIANKTFTWSSSDESVATVSTSGEVTAVANGSVTITATTDGINGTASVEVDQAAAGLAFTAQPMGTVAEGSITPAVEVTIQDGLGNAVTGATDAVTVVVGTNPGGGTLSGTTTVNALNGIATFSDLSIDQIGVGYTLVATSGTLPNTTSDPFDIVVTFVMVTAGSGHTCSATTNGITYCWGTNQSGQLGIHDPAGTPTHSPTPTLVSGGRSFATVAAGNGHTCGVTMTAGDAYCWGSGKLGDDSFTRHDSPVLVHGGLTFATVSAGESHTCGVTTTGAAYCWGDNLGGQLGDGTTDPFRLTPVSVSGGLMFELVSAGFAHCPSRAS